MAGGYSIPPLDGSVILGGGFVVAVLFLALVERLRRTFATGSEMNGLGERLNALLALYLQVREALDELRDRVARAEIETGRQTEQRHMVARLTARLDAVCQVQGAQGAEIGNLGWWIKRVARQGANACDTPHNTGGAMTAIRARLAAIVASYIVAQLTAWGVNGLTPEISAGIARWLDHTFELALVAGYAVFHPWLQRRINPTGAMTGEAARRLEHVAKVDADR